MASQLSSAQQLAAGVHALPIPLAKGFAATQAAWRFYGNERVTLPMLCAPLLDHARQSVEQCCDQYLLAVLDWSNLHYNGHDSKQDRVALSSKRDLGYEMLTALAVSDRDGAPIAPLCLDLRARDGVHTTRCATPTKPLSQLDWLTPVMDDVTGQTLGKPLVFIVDREADSVGHFRRWDRGGKQFVVRANDNPKVFYEARQLPLKKVAKRIGHQMKPTRSVLYKGKPAEQFVAETTVVLTRPAYQHRVGKDKRKKHKIIPGPAIVLRLIVAEVRDGKGKVLARWLLLSNLPSSVPGTTIALWYYWRWRIESYHKLLKSAGQQIEQWQQETAATLVRRLLVTAMSVVLVWHIARDPSPQAEQLRDALVQLSGRQIKRGRNARRFTESALLAGLGILIPMLTLLQGMSLEDLKAAAAPFMPLIQSITRGRGSQSG
jgi:hypothetical protein